MTAWWIGLHIAAGCVALLTMPIPLLSAKGGAVHRRAGRVYAVAMGAVVVLAWITVAARLAGGARPTFPLFLALVGLLAGASVWAGWRVLRERGRTAPHRDALDRAVQGTLACAGVVGAAYGLLAGQPLFLAFGALCAVLGVGELRAMAAVPTDPRQRVVRHLSAMLAACISTTTAVLVVNLDRLPEALTGLIPLWMWWLVPTALGTPAIVAWSRRVALAR